MKDTVRDPDGVRHRLDWLDKDWLHRTICKRRSRSGWVFVPTAWDSECPTCFAPVPQQGVLV